MNNVTLGYVRLQAKDRADMQNNPSITDAMWNEYISKSYKECEDLMIGAYGNDYFGSTPFSFNLTGGNTTYPLPDGKTLTSLGSTTVLPPFYKLTGVDLMYSSSPTGYITLKKFEFIERNRNQFPGTMVSLNGRTNLKYKLAGNNQIQFNQLQATGTVRVHYIPEPPNLVYAPCVATTINSPVVIATDITGLSVGMTIFSPISSIPSGTTITAINASTNAITMSNNALSSVPILVVQCWRDDSILMGMLAGWEEYVICDAAIKAGVKSETDLSAVGSQKQAMKMRIESMAEGRDAGQASHVSDALGSCGGGDDGWDEGGMGGMY